MSVYESKVREILTNLDRFHDNYYARATFHGPSLHFHKRVLETGGGPDFERHLEYVYAALVSWGMHRMGRGGSKMGEFETFRDNLLPMRETVSVLRQRQLGNLSQADWDMVERLFKSIKVMATSAHLVGHSKVLAHLVPQIASPIDRNYTLYYLRGKTNLPNNLDKEWRMFKDIHTGFVLPVAASKEFQERAAHWLARQAQYPWDTSIPKIIDNLLIGWSPSLAAVSVPAFLR
jgi:hypothetical protein